MNESANLGQSEGKPQAERRRRLLLISGVIILVVGLALLVVSVKSMKKSDTTASAPQAKATAVVQITPTGFVPASLNVKPFTKVVWVNTDAKPHDVDADPYPTHKDLPALATKQALGEKQTYSYIFTSARTVNYHDDLNPTWSGSITVQ